MEKGMSELTSEAERRILQASLSSYRQPNERAALRCALGDAAGLLDAFAKEVANHQRRGRYIKKRGQEDAALITRAADKIWQMREKINVRDNAPIQPPEGE